MIFKINPDYPKIRLILFKGLKNGLILPIIYSKLKFRSENE